MAKRKKTRGKKLAHWGVKDKMALLLFGVMGAMVVFSVAVGIWGEKNAGGPNITFEEYEKQELALDDSTENVLYVEPENTFEMQMEIAKLLKELEDELKAVKEENGALQEEEQPVEPKYDFLDETEIPDVEYPFYIKVNRAMNCVTVYTLDRNGEYTIPVKAMICSVGKKNATPLGVFRTSTKYQWRELFGNVFGQYAYRIHNSIMFHSVPYHTKNKNDLKTEEYNKLGEEASLGCIRLKCVDAKWLVDFCPEGTTVEIYDDKDNPGPLGKPTATKIDVKSKYAGWDPTDPDKKNPWGIVTGAGTDAKENTGAGAEEAAGTDAGAGEGKPAGAGAEEAAGTDAGAGAEKPVIRMDGKLSVDMDAQGNPEDVVIDNARMTGELLVSNQVSATDAGGGVTLTPTVQSVGTETVYDKKKGRLGRVDVRVRVAVSDDDGRTAEEEFTVKVKIRY